MEKTYTASELLFAATSRCKCGAGLAYPPDDDAWCKKEAAWCCSAVLMGLIPDVPEQHGKHDAYPWMMYEIKSEDQPSAAGRTTRLPGDGRVEVRAECACKKCGRKWESEWRSPAASNVWHHSDCPGCGEPAYLENGGSNYQNIDMRCGRRIVA